MAPTDLLTMDEAARAIYLDFEGRTAGPPVLLGVLYAEGRKRPDPSRLVMRHDIVDPVFAPLNGVMDISTDGGLYRYDTAVRHLWVAVSDVVRRAEHQDRLIVAWSQHELNLVRETCQAQGLSAAFDERFRDGKATARRWLKSTHPELVPERSERGGAHRLSHYLDVVGWEVPDDFGAGVVGDNLRILRGALEKGRTWEQLTEKQQRGWWQVIGHNLHDCLGLREVVLTAAAGSNPVSDLT